MGLVLHLNRYFHLMGCMDRSRSGLRQLLLDLDTRQGGTSQRVGTGRLREIRKDRRSTALALLRSKMFARLVEGFQDVLKLGLVLGLEVWVQAQG